MVFRIALTVPVAVFVVVVVVVPVVVVPVVVVPVVVPVVVVPVAATGVTVIVAEVTMPLPLVVRVTGFWMLSSPTQFKPPAPSVAFKRFARKPKSVVAVAPPSGEGRFWNVAMSPCRRGNCTLTIFWQYVVVLAAVAAAPVSDAAGV